MPELCHINLIPIVQKNISCPIAVLSYNIIVVAVIKLYRVQT